MVESYSLDIRKGKNNDSVFAYKLEVGLKVKVREDILDTLKNNSYIKENIKLNIIRLNRWWYSVYFDKICLHDKEPIMFGGNCFCKECGIKLSWEEK